MGVGGVTQRKKDEVKEGNAGKENGRDFYAPFYNSNVYRMKPLVARLTTPCHYKEDD